MSEVTSGYEDCPDWAPAVGYAGAGLCMILANWGSAWGTWRAGLGVCQMGIDYPKGIIKNIVPIVMAGVLGIYGLIVAVIIGQSIMPPEAGDATTTYSTYNGWAHLAAGLCCGLSCLAAGGTIGLIGDVGVRCFGLRATGGRRCWDQKVGGVADHHHDKGGGADHQDGEAAAVVDDAMRDARNLEDSNKLFVGLLIMLIFAEALALYGLIVALILSQHSYYCGEQ